MADLVQTLEALISPNNELRKQAETFYNQAAEANPAQLALRRHGKRLLLAEALLEP